MKIHGYPSGGELLAVALMLLGAIGTVVLIIVALCLNLTDRTASWWWAASAISAAVSFGAWFYL